MQALIGTRRATRDGDKWLHPETGDDLDYAGEGDIFIISIEMGGDQGLTMVVNRTTLEQVRDNMSNALEREEMVIRRA